MVRVGLRPGAVHKPGATHEEEDAGGGRLTSNIDSGERDPPRHGGRVPQVAPGYSAAYYMPPR